MREPVVIGVTPDQYQRRRLKLSKGDLRLVDGRVLRPRIGYDLRRVATNLDGPYGRSNEATRKGFLESAGWRHAGSGLAVGASIDDTRWGPLLHVSMSYASHDPTWHPEGSRIKLVKAAFFPQDVDAAMILPRPELYVNIHSHTFHLIQLPQAWGIG